MSSDQTAAAGTALSLLIEHSRAVLGVVLGVVGVVALVGYSLASSVLDRRQEETMQALGAAVQQHFRLRADELRRAAAQLARDESLRDMLGTLTRGDTEPGAGMRQVMLTQLSHAGLGSSRVLAVYDRRGQPLVYVDGRGDLPTSGYFSGSETNAGIAGGQYATPLRRESLQLASAGVLAWRQVQGEYCLMQSAPVHGQRQLLGHVAVLLCNPLETLGVVAPAGARLSFDWWPDLAGQDSPGGRELQPVQLTESAELMPAGPVADPGRPFREDDHLSLALRLPGDVAGPEYLVLGLHDADQQFTLLELAGAGLAMAVLAALAAVPLFLWRVRRRIAPAVARLDHALRALRIGDFAAVQNLAKGADERAFGGSELWRLGELASVQALRSQELSLWASVFQRSRDAIFICNPDGMVQYVNAALLGISGRSAEDLLGRQPSFLRAGLHDEAFYVAFWQTLSQSGEWQGEIWDLRADGSSYPLWLSMSAIRDEAGEILHYLGMYHDISERKAQEAHIRHLVHFDALTHLPNRGLLRDRLQVALAHAQREQGMVALLFVDLDRFKLINDTLGHAVGDGLLKEVAERIKRAVRGSDTVCRQGADEFIVMLDRVRNQQDAELVAEHIIAVLAPVINVMGHELSITTSIGISLFPQDARDADELIRKADVAMYHAKSLGRNNYQMFRKSMSEHAEESLSLEQELRLAVDRDEFVLHFQPQVAIATRQLVGVEALVRWRHPVQGLVSPATFIPLAEESGLILQIGDWVLREACRQRAEWTRAGLARFPVAINVSALQFRQPDFARRVREAMSLFGVTPDELELELTESIVMQEDEAAGRTLAELQQVGVGLAIDDFGTGYSSLGYLKRLPIDKLKVDGSFVRGVESAGADRAIVEAIISMGHALGLALVAEGVEQASTLQALRSLGCELAQGYYYSRPVAAEAFVVWLEEFGTVGETG